MKSVSKIYTFYIHKTIPINDFWSQDFSKPWDNVIYCDKSCCIGDSVSKFSNAPIYQVLISSRVPRLMSMQKLISIYEQICIQPWLNKKKINWGKATKFCSENMPNVTSFSHPELNLHHNSRQTTCQSLKFTAIFFRSLIKEINAWESFLDPIPAKTAVSTENFILAYVRRLHTTFTVVFIVHVKIRIIKGQRYSSIGVSLHPEVWLTKIFGRISSKIRNEMIFLKPGAEMYFETESF